jgi:hypothetical protein
LIAGLVPPEPGTVQLVGETHRNGPSEGWVTDIVFGEPLMPDADTVIVPVLCDPVRLESAVIVNPLGVSPLVLDTLSQSKLSLAVQLNVPGLLQLVTEIIGLVAPVPGAVQASSDTHRAAPVMAMDAVSLELLS